jgi:hypothetical protein
LPPTASLQSVITWRFDEADLHAFRHLFALERLTLKEAPYLESLSGLSGLPMLEKHGVFLARKLLDISDIAGLASSLRDLEFEDCPGIAVLDDVQPLVNLRFLCQRTWGRRVARINQRSGPAGGVLCVGNRRASLMGTCRCWPACHG